MALAKNGAINSIPINHAEINGGEFKATGSGSLISIEQKVARIGSGELVSIEQTVQLRLSSSVAESMISIEQIVEAVFASASLISIEQQVKDSSVPDHLSRTGWDATLVINGQVIDNSTILGMIKVRRTENDAALMDITLLPATGAQDIESYHGKTVTLDITTASGTFRTFTGVVDIPEIDLIKETITLRCTDRRTELLNAQLPGIVETIGLHDSNIFSAPKDTAEEVRQRLTTTPESVDFDAYGNYTITSWTPKSTADYTFTDSDVYRNAVPKVEFTSRGRVVNKIDIQFQYRYERFYHHSRIVEWSSPIEDDICNLLVSGYSLTPRAMIRSAADAAGWPISSDGITYTAIWPSSWYRCSGSQVSWSTSQPQGISVPVLDEKKNQRTDANGKLLYTQKRTGAIDYGGIYCMAASWTATKRWSQTVTETYALTVQSPQSQAQYGNIESDINYSVTDETADTAGWENYQYFTSGSGPNYYLDQDADRSSIRNSMNVAIYQARTAILSSHRDTRVTVDTFIKPEIDLKHTVLVNTDEIVAKGKVFMIEHSFNISTSEARTSTTIVLSRVQGSSSDSAITLPSKPSDSVTYNTQNVYLGNHFAEDPTPSSAVGWTGMIGNAWITENNNTFKTTYAEQFIVDMPAVSDALRQAKDLSGSASYNVVVPNDSLTITFDGKS